MSKITTIGLDLAKHVFHVVCCNVHGKVIRKNMLKRSQVLAYFSNLPQCLVGMEGCASAHHWARELGALGHEVKLIPPQYVKPYVRGNKNDYNDALAIAEAVTRAEMRFVWVKTPEQQDIQALHRLRERRLQDAYLAVQAATGTAGRIRADFAQRSQPTASAPAGAVGGW